MRHRMHHKLPPRSAGYALLEETSCWDHVEEEATCCCWGCHLLAAIGLLPELRSGFQPWDTTKLSSASQREHSAKVLLCLNSLVEVAASLEGQLEVAASQSLVEQPEALPEAVLGVLVAILPEELPAAVAL